MVLSYLLSENFSSFLDKGLFVRVIVYVLIKLLILVLIDLHVFNLMLFWQTHPACVKKAVSSGILLS